MLKVITPLAGTLVTVMVVVLLFKVSVKVTVPLGVPVPGGVTLKVAVNKTDWPEVDGLGLEASTMLVAACPTFWTKLVERLPVKLLSPL